MASEDPEWLARMYDQYAESLFRTAFGWSGSRADAEDAVQEVFTALAKGMPAIANERAYLFTSLRNQLFRKTHQPLLAALPTDVPGKAATERDEDLERALSRLPDEQRDVVVLKIDGDLTFAEIAEVLGISPNTAASRYRYALDKLRVDLEKTQ